MPRHNCSLLQRLCKRIEYHPDTQTLTWHGRWKETIRPYYLAAHGEISSYKQPVFDYDKTIGELSVIRFVFFQLYELTGSVPQEQIMVKYMYAPEPGELCVSRFDDLPLGREKTKEEKAKEARARAIKGQPEPEEQPSEHHLLRGYKDEYGLIKAPSVPLKGNLIAFEINGRRPRQYRPCPAQFPQVTGQARVPLVMHYLKGGTDEAANDLLLTRPARVQAKRKPTKRGTSR